MPGHLKCYAQSFCNCSQTISGEHYVSEGVLLAVSQANKKVRVSGLRFQPADIAEERPIKGLTSNILCEKHNSDLSAFDAAGLHFFGAMEHAMVPDSPVVPMQTCGNQVERWMLKTLCGGVYGGAFKLPDDDTLKGQQLPAEWLRVLFQNDPLPPRIGLYIYHGEEGEQFPMDNHVLRLHVLIGNSVEDGKQAVMGLRMWFFGIEFLLCMANMPDPLPGRMQHTIHRPTHITGAAGRTLVLDWAGDSGVRGVRFDCDEFEMVDRESARQPN